MPTNKPGPKLTKEQVMQIDCLLKVGFYQHEIADLFNISKYSVNRINCGLSHWKITGKKRLIRGKRK